MPSQSNRTVVTIRVPSEDLVALDAEAAGSSRTQCILNAVRAEIVRRKRARLDEEVGRLLARDGQENMAIEREFAQTFVDGLE